MSLEFASLKLPSASTDSIAAVLFDLDGTLVDSMMDFVHAWQRAFGEHGILVSTQQIYEHEGEQSTRSVRKFFTESRGHEPSEGEVASILHRYRDAFGELYETRIFPGALELLDRLKVAGIPMGLVTGSSTLETRFQKYPTFLAMFDAIVTGPETPRGKPYPDPFIECANRLNLPVEKCLVVENAPLGIQSAHAAGCPCVAVMGNTPLPETRLKDAGARIVFPSLQELEKALFS